jgi:site-specific DNA-methyltransferase (adenine-specific)
MDPFTGSGSTGRGAVLEGFTFIGFQYDPEDPNRQMIDIANARILDAYRLLYIDGTGNNG